MNDKIKVLAEQSGIGWDDKYHWYVGAPQLQKYTEAVIRECMTICEDVTERNEPTIACYYAIKEHFGV